MTSNETLSQAKIFCEFFGVFFLPLPSLEDLENNLIQQQDNLNNNGHNAIASLHVAMLSETESQYETIRSFLKQGKLGVPKKTSVSNYVNHYVGEIYLREHNDLVVIMATTNGDIVWGEPDRYGHNGGYPNIPYSREQYGEPIRYGDRNDLRHIPPDRILGFYYFDKSLLAENENR